MTTTDASVASRDGPVKLLFVTHNVPRFPGDAAGSFVLRLAVALQQAGAHVDIIAPGAAGLPESDTQLGVSIQRVRYAADDRMTLAYSGTMAEAVRRSWSARWTMLGLLRHMRRAVRSALRVAEATGQPYDVVHAHWWFPSGVVAMSAGAGNEAAPPLVITLHGSDVRLAQSFRISHPVMRRVLQRALAVTAVSSWLAQCARSLVGDVDVRVAPMPVDVDLFAPPAHASGRSGVLFIGRLNKQKGLGDLLQALAQMRETDTTLDVVGDGAEAASLREHAAQHGVMTRVRWHGALAQQELVPLYQRACVVAIPSVEEGLGLVAVEAQLCGTPVVAYESGGLPDVVNAALGGTLVPPRNIAALASALDQSIAGGRAKSLAARTADSAARNAMLDAFSPASVARRYLALYDSVRRERPSA